MITPQSYEEEEEIIQRAPDGKFELMNVDLLDDVETLRYTSPFLAMNVNINYFISG